VHCSLPLSHPPTTPRLSADLKTWTPAVWFQDGRNIRSNATRHSRFAICEPTSSPQAGRDSRLLGGQGTRPRRLARVLVVSPIPEGAPGLVVPFSPRCNRAGSYLTVACNGVHGHEGAWVALRVEGRWVGRPAARPILSREPMGVSGESDRPQLQATFIPVTRDMLGKACEVVVLGLRLEESRFQTGCLADRLSGPVSGKDPDLVGMKTMKTTCITPLAAFQVFTAVMLFTAPALGRQGAVEQSRFYQGWRHSGRRKTRLDAGYDRSARVDFFRQTFHVRGAPDRDHQGGQGSPADAS